MIKWHKAPLFGTAWFAFCPNEKEWQAQRAHAIKVMCVDIGPYQHDGKKGPSGLFTCWIDEHNNKCGIITLADWLDKEPVKIIGVLAHEAVHCAEMIFESAHEDKSGEETRAYMVGHIVETIWTDYVKTRGVPTA
jgi:hypothetical protein